MAISFILAFIYLLLSTLYVPSTIIGSGDLKVYKIYLKTCPHVVHRDSAREVVEQYPLRKEEWVKYTSQLEVQALIAGL